jgi:hypothetical protein
MERKSNQGRNDSSRQETCDDTHKYRASFKSRLELDRNDLDTAAVVHPSLACEVGEAAVLAKSRVDELKFELEREMVNVELDIRDNANGDKKPTDKAVAAEVQGAKSVIRLKKALLDAQRELGLWNNLRDRYDDRKDMLKVLTQQYASNYFTRSSTTASTGRVTDREADEARTKGGEERRKRMKE